MTKAYNLARIEQVFQEVFDCHDLKITEQTTAEDLEEWDSLTHLTLISALEAEFKISFTLAETIKMHSVAEILAFVAEKQSKNAEEKENISNH